jgi:predicted TPR repeat methyltransferase
MHKAGRLSEAETMYLGILSRNAIDADALHFLGLLRLHQGRRPAATELMQRSLKLVPSNPHAWNNLGNLYMADGQEDRAEEAYTQATRLAPKLADAWYNLGILFRRKRNADAALLSFRRVLDSNPRFSRAYESLGLLLYRMGRSDLAADVYRKWLEVEPGNPVARHMSAATSGEHVPERAENRYVEKVFNEFASSFDESLKNLDYAAPQLLSAALSERIAFGDSSLDVLDAGCGTGLCGVLLSSWLIQPFEPACVNSSRRRRWPPKSSRRYRNHQNETGLNGSPGFVRTAGLPTSKAAVFRKWPCQLLLSVRSDYSILT